MKPSLYTLNLPGPGHLSILARPRGGDWLADEMRDVARSDVTAIVSMLTDAEATQLELDQEAVAAAEADLVWISCPTTDRSVPDIGVLMASLALAQSVLGDGGHVAVHCRMGIGRSSLFLASLLIVRGIDPDEAWDVIEAARGIPVPDTEAQRRWVERLVAQPE